MSSANHAILVSAKSELARMFKSVSQGKKGAMFCPFIDQVWHDMIDRDPTAYSKFCFDAVGYEVKHVVHQDGDPVVTEIDWVAEYERQFGRLHPVWFADKSGAIDLNAYCQYLQTGRVIVDPPTDSKKVTCFCNKF